MHKQANSRFISVTAFSGAVLLCIGTYLHPMDADPNMPLAAFTEYAASRHWIASHLMQLFGCILIVATLVLLSRTMADGPAVEWVTLGRSGAVASLAVASVLQAVDGIALKAVVDSWAATVEPGKTGLFHAAFGVRQIEIGLASIASLLFGLTISVYGISFLIDGRIVQWMGVLAILGGTAMAVGGIAIAHTGFSRLSMAINMSSSLLLIAWLLVLGVLCWRRVVFQPFPNPA